jgi:hypothetical protein
MLKKYASCLLAGLLVYAGSAGPALAKSKAEKEARQVEKVKAGIAKLGVGQEARVALKLKDKTKLAGYISEAGKDSFAVTDLKTGATTRVAYSDVAQVQGHNLSKGAKIAIVVGIVVAVAVVLYIVRGAFCDGC